MLSQAKVDRQKEYKKNRKEILAKEKRRQKLTKFGGYLCILAIVGGVGFSFYQKMIPKPEADTGTFYNLIATDEYGLLRPTLSE